MPVARARMPLVRRSGPTAEPPTIPLYSLLWQTWSGRYAVQGEVADADCVIGFAFGGVRDGQVLRPGASNAALADFARQHLAHLPLILQWEVADAYGKPAQGRPLFRIDRHRRPGKYLDTYEVAAQSRDLMDRHGWYTAVILAQGHHLPRAAQVCQKLGLQIVTPPGLGVVPFCPDACQWWTRGRRSWFGREAATMVYYRFWKQWM